MNLKGKTVLITGVGVRPVNFVFKDMINGQPTHTEVLVDGQRYKANIGAATALECAKSGANLHLMSSQESQLKTVSAWIEKLVPGAQINYSVVEDFVNPEQIQAAIQTIATDTPLYWVQSLGISAGSVKLKDDNPYLLIEETPLELLDMEMSALKATVQMMQLLRPRFVTQDETRVCVVTSIAAIRSMIKGAVHAAVKAAVSRFTNSLMLELNKNRIYITDIRPGIVDTGAYDSPAVQEAVQLMGRHYGHDYSETNIFCMPPSAVGETIVMALASDAHFTSINLVARGQWPQEGS